MTDVQHDLINGGHPDPIYNKVVTALDLLQEASQELNVQLWDTIKIKEYLMSYRLNHTVQQSQSDDAIDANGNVWEYKSIDMLKKKQRFIFKTNALDKYNKCEGIALATFENLILTEMYIPPKQTIMDILYEKAKIRKETQLRKGISKPDGNDEVNISLKELRNIPNTIRRWYYPEAILKHMKG